MNKRVLALVILGLGVVFMLTRNLLPKSSTCSNEVAAYVDAQLAIRDRLQSPSSADFPDILSSGVRVSKTGECEYAIRSYVEAQNAFGVKLRKQWSARASSIEGSDRWTITNIRIG